MWGMKLVPAPECAVGRLRTLRTLTLVRKRLRMLWSAETQNTKFAHLWLAFCSRTRRFMLCLLPCNALCSIFASLCVVCVMTRSPSWVLQLWPQDGWLLPRQCNSSQLQLAAQASYTRNSMHTRVLRPFNLSSCCAQDACSRSARSLCLTRR